MFTARHHILAAIGAVLVLWFWRGRWQHAGGWWIQAQRLRPVAAVLAGRPL